jgi:hypothetical protein
MTAITSNFPSVLLSENIPCLRCGYNLRALSKDSRCPECSTPVASSLNPTLLRYADPSWTSILALAFGLMVVSVALQAAYYVILLLLQRLDLFPVLGRVWDYSHILQRIYWFVDPLFWLGVFLAAHPSPHTTPHRHFWPRRVTRLVALIALLRAVLPETLVSQESSIEKPVNQIIELLATTLTFLYLLRLAKQTGIPRMVRHTMIAMTALIAVDCYAIGLEILHDREWIERYDFYIGWVVAAIFLYQAYLFFLFRRTLRKSAAFARQYWHFCSPLT